MNLRFGFLVSVCMRACALFALIALPMSSAIGQSTQRMQAQTYSVGVAKVDITPDYPIRMNGFLVRKEESAGVRQRLWAKALAIGSDKERPAILITVDTLGIPEEIRSEVAKRLQTKAGLESVRLAITASHTHTAPMINGCAPNIFGEPIPADAQSKIDRYTREFTDHLEAVALAALADRRDSTMHWGIGQVGFAKNRRDKNGPIDHDLPLLVVRDMQGLTRAIYVSYACHCVTLSERMLGGDWAGFAQEQIEKRFPQAVAMVSIGCGGDQNPVSGVTNDRFDVAMGQGEEIAIEVDRLVAGRLRPVVGPLMIQQSETELPLAKLPLPADFEKLAQEKTPIGYHARVQLAKLERGEKLREKIIYSIQSWSFGDSLAMLFLPGEVVSEYSLRLKSELDGCKLWVNAYANACPCYIPSEAVLRAGGYEGGGAMIYYDQPTKFAAGLEQRIIDVALGQLKPTFPSTLEPGKGKGTRPRAPEQSLKLLRTGGNLAVDLVAAEPLVTSPVAVDFAPDGKVYVAEMYDYPAGTDGNFGPGGRVRLLESTTQDGNFDRSTIFLDGIPFPTGVTVWRKGILVSAAPDILYAEDSDGDGHADIVKKIASGFGTDNYQARVNSLEYGLDGWVYGSCGLFGGTIRIHANNADVQLGDRDFRMQPDIGKLEAATGQTQQGRVRDDFGNWFGCDNSDLCFHYPLADHYVRRNSFAPPPPGASHVPQDNSAATLIPAIADLQLFKLSGASGLATAACGLGIYRDTLLGPEFQGNAFTCEPVNLVVHRLSLSPSGSTFKGKRPDEETSQEFLSSTDTWFRPVQARTAPDGSLWILDMYRFVIEHPRWIPPESLDQIDVRAGSSMGRIYRVRPRAKAKLAWPRLTGLTSNQLAEALDTENGWQRDMAMQMLLWNRENITNETLQTLRQILEKSSRPTARVQALATLGTLQRVAADDVLRGLSDEHPGVRCNAVRLTESFATKDHKSSHESENQLLPRLIEMAKNVEENGQVKIQLACTLGQWSSAQAASALLDMDALNKTTLPSDKYLQSAIHSSLNRDNVRFLANRIGQSRPELLSVALDLADVDTAVTIIKSAAETVANEQQEKVDWKTLTALLNRLERNPDLFQRVKDTSVMQTLAASVQSAREFAMRPEANPPMRASAASAINFKMFANANDKDLLVELLAPQNPVELQAAAMRSLLRGSDSITAARLMGTWKQLSPNLKSMALDGLLSRQQSTKELLDAIEGGTIAAVELDATRRSVLLAHKDTSIRTRAEKLLATKLNTNRIQVLEAYSHVDKLSGDSKAGRELFRKHCSNCHKLDDMGTAVGPDLSPLATKPVPFFLQEILDPNRNLDSRYMSYTAITESGQTIAGILAVETASAIVLRGAEGKETALQRSDIAQLSSTRSSLMPEGLEQLIKPQEMTDVIAFVRSMSPPSLDPKTLAVGELARDLLDDSLGDEARTQLVPYTVKSAAEVITAMAANMPQNEVEEYRRIPWIWRVAIAAGKEGDTQTLRKVLECSLPREQSSLRDWQAVVIGGGLINGLSLRGEWPRASIESLMEDAKLKQRWQATIRTSVSMADSEKVRNGTRYDALRIVAMAAWPESRDQLARYLTKDVDAELQMGAVSGLGDVPTEEAAELLVQRYSQLTPGNRKLALEALIRDNQRQKRLLAALERKEIQVNEVANTIADVMKGNSDREIATQAKRLLP